MAYIESAVVVYLRELFALNGIQFPIIEMTTHILVTEVGREVATILLLFAYAKSIGRNSREVMAYFMLNFGIWDIWYYVWLKALLNWPATLLDWDILFLIPLPWIGPVLAPVLVAFSLVLAGYLILRHETENNPIRLNLADWILEIISGIIIILSFLIPNDFQSTIDVPGNYPWWLFLVGLIFGWVVFLRRLFFEKNKHTSVET
jgi:hypothetical protein